MFLLNVVKRKFYVQKLRMSSGKLPCTKAEDFFWKIIFTKVLDVFWRNIMYKSRGEKRKIYLQNVQAVLMKPFLRV